MGKGFLVLGTDTGVGKTLVTAGLVRALLHQGIRAAAMKPVVSGGVMPGYYEGQTEACWEDSEILAMADRDALTLEERSPYRFMMPASPHFAAEAEGRTLCTEHLVQAIQQQISRHERVLVEGVGGLRVPLKSDGYDLRDLAAELKLPVILVVGLRLGCINHGLLTMESLQSQGLEVVAWVANKGVDAHYQNANETIRFLEGRFGLECALTLPMLTPPLVAANPRLSFDRFKAGLEEVVSASSVATQALAERLVEF